MKTTDSPTVVRAFELPLHHLEAGERDGWDLLRECWREGTCLANWGVQQLLRADVTRLPEMEKLPKMPLIKGVKLKGLYGLASESFAFKTGWWAGACNSASTILHTVEQKYRSERLNVLWHRKQDPTTYRYPYPWPVHARGWKEAGFEDGRPFVRLALPGGEVVLRLRGGPEFGLQLGRFRQVVAGNLPRLQLVIRQQGASLGCHRPTVKDRGKNCRVMVKMVAKLPAKEATGNRVLTLSTDPNAFWVAELDGRQAWVLNNDHMRRAFDWLAKYDAKRQRLAQDRKAERRMNRSHLADINEAQRRCGDKHARRMQSWLHETAAHLVGFCVRNHVGEVLYLDGERDFIPAFPWHRLKSLLSDKLTAAGIQLVTETAHEQPEDVLCVAR